MLKRSIQKKNWSGHYFKRADYQWSTYPSNWGSMSRMFTAMIPNISIILLAEYPYPTFTFNSWLLPSYVFLQSRISRLFSVDSTACFLTHSSMDVQGDYDPCDASGFIRINAVRLVIPNSCTKRLKLVYYSDSFHTHSPYTYTLNSHHILCPSCSPLQIKGTPSFAGFLRHQLCQEVTVAVLWTIFLSFFLPSSLYANQ